MTIRNLKLLYILFAVLAVVGLFVVDWFFVESATSILDASTTVAILLGITITVLYTENR